MDTHKNILFIRFKSIGDILFTLPAVHVVRENFPSARLHFLVASEYAPLLRGFADVDGIITLDRAVFHAGNLSAACRGVFGLMRNLRREHFSLTVDFQGYGETAFLSWWSGAPERWGSVYRFGRAWAYTRGEWRDNKIHPAEWNLSLLRQCGLKTGVVRNEFVLPDDALKEANHFFAANDLDVAKKTLFLQPFTSSSHKNWPLENFLALAQHFCSQNVQIVFGGGPNEYSALELVRAAGFTVSAGAPLLVTAGLMKLSTFIVGGDTGLLHLAVAMGKRVAMLMSSTASGKPHPFRHVDWAVTPPPGKRVSEISADVVIHVCERVLVGKE